MPSPTPYAPCPGCQALVLTGQTRDGTAVCLDVSQRTYVALWEPSQRPKACCRTTLWCRRQGIPSKCVHPRKGVPNA